MSKHTKQGARHSRTDQTDLQMIHDSAKRLGAMCEEDMPEGEAKRLDEIKARIRLRIPVMLQRKGITDAPNLRGNDQQTCSNCRFYKYLPSAEIYNPDGTTSYGPQRGICEKHGFETQGDYVCDDWKQFDYEEMMASPEKSLITFGGAVKALGSGKVGGYLVRFSGDDAPDLEGEYFTAATDFGEANKLPVLYQHGLDTKIGRRRIGTAEAKKDDAGLWLEAQLNLRDEYEKAIYQLAEQNKLGWSSGAAAHTVERVKTTKATHITQWYIAEASLTPTPAEPRNAAISLKSYQALQHTDPQAEAEGTLTNVPPQATVTASSTATTITFIEGATPPTEAQSMDEIKTVLDAALKPLQDQIAAQAQELKAVTTALKAEPPATKAANITVEPEQKLPYKSVTKVGAGYDFTGLGDQLKDIAKAARGEGTSARLVAAQDLAKKNLKAALGVNEEVGSEGGFLVQHDNAGWLADRTFAESQLAAMCTNLTVGAGANGIKLNDWDETSRADGSHYGGMAAYWLNEAGTFTASQPNFRQIDLQLGKLTALYYATDEELEDAVGLSSRISVAYPRVMRWKIDNAILRGTGGGQPTGIIGHSYTVSITKETGQAATTLLFENLVKMHARMIGFHRAGAVWLINQDIEPQLFAMSMAVGTGGVPVYMPANGLSASPYGTLFGRPVIPVEQTSSLGTVGDIIFANFADYLLAKKGDVQQASSIHVQFLTGQQVFRFAQRVTGQPAYSTVLTPANGSNTQSAFVTLATRS